MTRALLLIAVLLLTACTDAPAPTFEKLDFDYLTKIKIDVGTIDIDDSWAPSGPARQVGFLAPTRPVAALRLMASQRLVPGGTSGSARFVIDNASIIEDRGQYVGDFAVHIELTDAEGQPTVSGVAKVHGTQRATDDEDGNATRVDLDTLVRKLMELMNVEFEFQLRKTLHDKLQSTSPTAPAPDAVDTQDLQAPVKPKP